MRSPPQRKRCRLNPTDSAAVIAYTRAEVTAGDPAKAVAKWQQWTKDHPTDVRGLTLLGTLQESQGDRNGAMDSYKKALAIQPERPIAANNLAYLMVDSGQNLDVALSLAQVARRGMPNFTQHGRHSRLDLLPEGQLCLRTRSA